jgi:uncharacterized protein YjcR
MKDKYYEACKRYIAGESLAQIAPDYGVSVTTLQAAFKRRKVPMRPQGRPKTVAPFVG